MAPPHSHSISSAKSFGGAPEDYIRIHDWFDATKAHWPKFTHRALRHHTLGIQEAVEKFGDALGCITTSSGRRVSVRLIGEQHLMEDHGCIPTVQMWLERIPPARWMTRSVRISERSE